MNILIIGEKHDYHVAAVCWGIKQLGCRPILWDMGEFPNSYECSLRISNELDSSFCLTTENEYFTDINAVWNRRRSQPKPLNSSDSADHPIIKRESLSFIRNFYSLLSNGRTRWINSLINAQIAQDKFAQLAAAKSVNFSIPSTLMSNDHQKVEQFIEQNSKSIYKAFLPGGWLQSNGNQNILRAALVQKSDLTNPITVKSCPGIFQVYQKKKYDIRVTVIGEEIIAVRIESQLYGEIVDWRYDGNYSSYPLEQIELPTEVKDKCFAVCKQLGLVFACIDLVLSEDDEYIFLEINEAGQFLWKEAKTEVPLLHTFCSYLAFGYHTKYDNKVNMRHFEKSSEYNDFRTYVDNTKIADNKVFIKE